MKVVIFAGGPGTRISGETDLRPKPMVEIGGKPILWHIMKSFSQYGLNEFIICLGYKGHMIKEYFMRYFWHNSDITVELKNNKVDIHGSNTESFKVTLVDTGLETKTAGRLKQVKKYTGHEDFILTYGDCVSDINMKSLIDFHQKHKKIATIAAVQMDSKTGGIDLGENGKIVSIRENTKDENNWINGRFFVLKPEVFAYLEGNMDSKIWEDEPLEKLLADDQLVAYRHKGFWKLMDASRDKLELESLWQSNKAKWKTW